MSENGTAVATASEGATVHEAVHESTMGCGDGNANSSNGRYS